MADRNFFALRYGNWRRARARTSVAAQKNMRMACESVSPMLLPEPCLSFRAGLATQNQRHRSAVIDYRLEGVEDAEPDLPFGDHHPRSRSGSGQRIGSPLPRALEIETAFDELKTHLRGAHIVLRSKTPDLVRQEFYGLLMAHFAIRGLMHEAALKADLDPDRLSFLHAVRVIRAKWPSIPLFPPRKTKPFHEQCSTKSYRSAS